MADIVDQSERLRIRRTQKKDIEFVLRAEYGEDNAPYIGQWTKEQHINALAQKDLMHLIVEERASARTIGYVIIAGIENPNHSIEFKRFVIIDKGKGYGREALKLIKKISFEQFGAHRLWLDVRYKNLRAEALYRSEGFIREGVLRECILYNQSYESLIIMSLLRDEYLKQTDKYKK